MSGFKLKSSGEFKKTKQRLSKLVHSRLYSELNRYGEMGLVALQQATPVRTGLTAASWRYRIINNKKHASVIWYNTNMVDGVPLVILLQYGHATGTGGYVQGDDFINPAMRPIFNNIAADLWKKVTS